MNDDDAGGGTTLLHQAFQIKPGCPASGALLVEAFLFAQVAVMYQAHADHAFGRAAAAVHIRT